MSKEKLTKYKSLEEEARYKGRPNSIEDNNVDYNNCNIYAMRQKIADLEAKLAEKQEQYQNAVSNCVNLANTKAILKLKKVQDRIDDMKSKYDCDIEYHLGANNELTHLWEYIDKLIEEMKSE